MKSGDKLQNRKNRRIVYYVGSYREAHSGKTVINFRHPGNKNRHQVGAMYKEHFNALYRMLPASIP